MIVVGGGTGTRFGRPKQYEPLGGERVLDRSVRIASTVADGVTVVIPAADAEREGGVAGGATRSDSVRAGLGEVPDDVDIVCVHDAARPLATVELYRRVIAAVAEGAAAAVPGVPVNDTIKEIDPTGRVVATPDRSRLVAVQTPQAFRREILIEAHGRGGDATDDAGLVEALGASVVVVPGDPVNRKITVADDLAWAERRLEERV